MASGRDLQAQGEYTEKYSPSTKVPGPPPYTHTHSTASCLKQGWSKSPGPSGSAQESTQRESEVTEIPLPTDVNSCVHTHIHTPQGAQPGNM